MKVPVPGAFLTLRYEERDILERHVSDGFVE
ncbi:hypothetical protein J2125_004961 [Erwinia toletana]|uniref:Uncharacterized protein n=1 Tax=Winslowiella toletana TaxID=92490 RepID=A0ABS4PG92_9GAMM|nr:hypothetical protein [Winslowiella toletana]